MKEIENLREKLSSFSKEKIREQLDQWEELFRPDDECDFFRGGEEMPDFDPEQREFSSSNAWWLGELCRISYTPDHKESSRKRNEDKPDRKLILKERSSFQEIHSIHKTGNHASIFLWKSDSGKKGTVLCFRGTKKLRQWIMNMLFRPHNWERFRKPDDTDAAFVHSGFYVFFKRVWPLLQEELEQCPRPWIFTGHSLGGALATIAGIVAEPESVYTFGSPKAGNRAFADLAAEEARFYHIRNSDDIVPLLPLPDEKLGEKQFDHGGNSFWLNESGEIQGGTPDAPASNMPFPINFAFSSENLGKAPSWVRDHRIGRYCRKLQKLSVTSSGVSDH